MKTISYIGILLAFVASCTNEEPPANLGDVLNPNKTSESSFYVSPMGDDSNAGNKENPWATFAHAVNILSEGDTLFLRDGTYNEMILPAYSGLEEAPIVYMAYPGESPIIDGEDAVKSNYYGIITIDVKSNITVSGIRFVNSGKKNNNGGIIIDESKNITIENCSTYQTKSSGIGVWNSDNIVIKGNSIERACDGGEQECLTIGTTTNFEVFQNKVFNNGDDKRGGEGIDIKDGSQHGVVYENEVYNIKSVGIYLDAADKKTTDIKVYNNKVHNIIAGKGEQGIGISVASEAGGLLTDIEIFNNLVYNCDLFGMEFSECCDGSSTPHPLENIFVQNNTFYNNGIDGTDGGGIVIFNKEVKNIVFRNNIIANNKNYQLAADFTDYSELTIDNNIVYGTTGNEGEILSNTSIELDPKFVDSATNNYQLQSTSPAIDAGASTGAPTFDLNYAQRPLGLGFDIGAYESF